MARIDLIDLAHSYHARAEKNSYALKPMTMSWRNGGAYALLGPSGCGKTTLLNIISGLIAPSQGKVTFNGVDVTRQPTQSEISRKFFSFQ